jgi:orotidine-5'-phosphate decarboxylase
MTERKPEDQLIVAADFSPDENLIGKAGSSDNVRGKVMMLAEKLRDLGVYIKVNSILRACGFDLIKDLHDLGLRAMADLKLHDIPNTLETDAILLQEFKPDIVTVMCAASVEAMMRVREKLDPVGSKILGVTVLTTMDDAERMSPKEIELVKKRRELQPLSVNTPGIRPDWTIVKDDDQKRTDDIKGAFERGVDAIIMGRPIIRHADPREAVKRTLGEIETCMTNR